MAGLFSKAVDQAPNAEPRKKETRWVLSADHPLNQAVADVHRHHLEEKTAKGKLDVVKSALKQLGDERLLQHVADAGELPPTPIVIQNADGQTVSYVMKKMPAEVKADQLELLGALIGEEQAACLLRQKAQFKLNQEILAIAGVKSVVERYLENAIRKLVKDQVLTLDQANKLVEAEKHLVFELNTLDAMPKICGNDPGKLRGFIAAMGPSLTRYVQV